MHKHSTGAQPLATRTINLTVTTVCGGVNGYRTRLWKVELQRLADEAGLAIQVCHFPPGTVTRGTRSGIGCSLSSPSTGAASRSPSLRRSSTCSPLLATRSDLLVFARLDEGSYPAKVTVSDAELEAVNLHGHGFHPEWNDTIESASNYLTPPNSAC
jgi:hypothetical protein